MAEDVVDLIEAAELPLEQVGGKARGLGRLVAAGFPVPPGFCLTVDAFAASPDGAEDEGDAGGPGRCRHRPRGPACRPSRR
ncbi:hypothetical protein ACWDVV_09050, partial [Streptomyces tendae]